MSPSRTRWPNERTGFARLLRFLRQPTPRRRWVLEALILLPIIDTFLMVRGYRHTRTWLERMRRSPPEAPVEQTAMAGQVTEAVCTAARRGPYRTTCLRESMVLWWMLGRRGLDARLRFGARRTGAVVEAHAWVEHDGKILNDTPDVRERFPPLEPSSGIDVRRMQ